MGISSKRRNRASRFHNLVNDDEDGVFLSSEEEVRDDVLHYILFFVQAFSLFLYLIPWISDETFVFGGSKTDEMPRDRRPFDEKISSKLTNYYFRRI